jgi:hypothetical protein
MTSLEILKSYLDINQNDGGRDTELQGYINRAIDLHNGYLSRKLQKESYTSEMHKNFERNIQVINYPIDTVTEIRIDGEVQDLANFRVWKNRGIIEKVDENRTIKITGYHLELDYTAGYDPMPGDLLEAEAMTAMSLESLSGAAITNTGVKRESVTGVSTVEYFDPGTSRAAKGGFSQIPEGARDILDLYRN